MVEAVPSDLIGIESCALIENMRYGTDATWRAVRVPREIAEASQLPAHTWEWKPVYLPTDCTGDRVFVSISDIGALTLTYKKSSGYYTTSNLLTGIDATKVRIGSDSQQFIFLDGRNGIGTYRITINEDGDIACRPFGTAQPITSPVINKITCERYENSEYTGMPVGSILFYAYCIVNEYGERSNPSPMTVCDTAQWFAKGTVNETAYEYTEDNQGSIKAVSVTCSIPVPGEAKRVELYRASAEYHEALAPLDPAKLVKSIDLSQAQDSVVITDTSFISPQEIDYENDVAPAGDDIILEAGRIFIANAISPRTFPVEAEKVFAIRITNPNPVSYINRWIAIDIRDKRCAVAIDKIADLDDQNELYSSIFYDTDMVTPLQAFVVQNDTAGFIDLSHIIAGTVKAWLLTYIRIPYIPAASDKTLYLVISDDYSVYDTPPFPTKLDPGTSSSVLEYRDGVLDNPVRDEKAIVATGTNRDTLSVNGWQKDGANKANSLMQYTGDTPDTAEYLLCDDEGFAGVLSSLVNIHGTSLASGSYLTEAADVTGGKRGYAYCFYSSAEWMVSGNFEKEIIKLSFDDGDIKLKVTGNLSHVFKLKAGDDYTSDLEVSHTFPDIGTFKVFVFLSWLNHNDGANMLTDITAAALVHYTQAGSASTERVWLFGEITDKNWGIADNQPPDLVLSGGTIHRYLSLGEYINDPYEVYELHRFMTRFPVEPIGYRSVFETISGSKYITNSNIFIESFSMASERNPGRLRWSFGGAVPQLNEYNFRDTIIGIASLKSFQPTDEHNTILVFTDRKAQRLSFSPDGLTVSQPVTELDGIGLQNTNSLITIDGAVIWSERTGVYMLTPSGLKALSLRRVNIADYSVVYDAKRRELLLINAQNEARIYNMDADVWSVVKFGYKVYGFIEFEGLQSICTVNGALEYSPEDDDTTLSPKIITGKLWARGKVRRITLPNASGTVRAIIHNHRLSGGTASTPTYTFTGGKPQAIPGLSGDAVQLEIVTDSIMFYDIEDNSDGN